MSAGRWRYRAAWAVALGAVVAVGGMVGRAGGQIQPGPSTPLIVESMVGRDLFAFYCASCHGRDGRGQGPVAASLKTAPPDLTVLADRGGGTFPRARVKDIIGGASTQVTPSHGPGEMPVWGPIFRFLDPSDARVKVRIDQLVNYVESIQAPH